MHFCTAVEITKIRVVRLRHGTDHVMLETKLPAATWPFEGTAHLTLDTARGTAEEYCEKNFPNVPVEVVTDY